MKKKYAPASASNTNIPATLMPIIAPLLSALELGLGAGIAGGSVGDPDGLGVDVGVGVAEDMDDEDEMLATCAKDQPRVNWTRPAGILTSKSLTS